MPKVSVEIQVEIHKVKMSCNIFCKFSLLYKFILIFCITVGSAKDLYNIFMKRMTCSDANPKFIYNFSCVTQYVSRNTTKHNVLINAQPGIEFHSIYVQIDSLYRVGNLYTRPLISMEENLCGFLAGTTKSYLIKVLWPFLKKSSNLDDSCPYHGTFNVTGLILDDSLMPPALPEGQARVDIHFRTGPKRLSIIKLKVYVEVKPKGATKLDF